MDKFVIDNTWLKLHVNKICRSLSASKWCPDYIVGLTRGGLVPAVMISHWLDVPMHSLNVSLRDNSTGPESNLWMANDAFAGKNILIVDDINDSGSTINWIMEDWASGCFPYDERWSSIWNNNVKFAVVVDNLSSKSKVAVDYAGVEINKHEKDVWVEFPWESWWS